jgi:hypothetical protein
MKIFLKVRKEYPGRRTVLMAVSAVMMGVTQAYSQQQNPCETLIRRYEAAHGIPDKLLTAISLVESGRKTQGGVVAWPWTINANGKPYVFDTKTEAINMVRKLRQVGVTSIDVGCMQINLKQHPGAFPTLSAAFDPASNIDYAAKFLKAKKVNKGSWVSAVDHYHSATAKFHIPYRAKVLKTWAKVQNGQTTYKEPLEPIGTSFESFMLTVNNHKGKFVETISAPSGRRLPVVVQFAPYRGVPLKGGHADKPRVSHAPLGRVGVMPKIIGGHRSQRTTGKLIIQKIGVTPDQNQITVHSVDLPPKIINLSAQSSKPVSVKTMKKTKTSKYHVKSVSR